MNSKYKPKKLFIEGSIYNQWYEKLNRLIKKNCLIKTNLTLQGNEEEVKEGKRLKFLTANKLLTRLPILLAQIKAAKNS